MTLLHQAAQKAVEAALRRAFHLGQIYWQQADSESRAQNRQAEITQLKFDSLVAETIAALQQQPEPPVHIDVERMNRALRGPRIPIPGGLSAEEVVAFINDHADRMAEQDQQQEVPDFSEILSGETMKQREEVCDAWSALPDELRKDDRLTRLYLALGGPRMDDPSEVAASPSTTRQQEVGSGWKLVPVEPTPEMIAAYLRANVAYWKRTDELPPPPNKWRTGTPSDATAESYRAMLAAAPSTPEKAGGVTAGGEELRPKFRGKCPDDSHCSFSCLKDEPCLRSNAAAREVAKRIAGVSASVSHPLPAQANDGGEHG